MQNVIVKDAQILTYNDDMETAAYIKTWVGELVPQSSYESDYLPRGGGWGVVTNILFENFYVQGASVGPDITQSSGNNGKGPLFFTFAATAQVLPIYTHTYQDCFSPFRKTNNSKLPV